MATDEYGLLNDDVDDEPMDYSPIGAEWKARAVAAEQRVHELEVRVLEEAERADEFKSELDTVEIKLAMAVEALKDALGLIDLMADESQCVLHDEIEAEEERLQQALSEIEQGDTK
jgi:hypothetical protein